MKNESLVRVPPGPPVLVGDGVKVGIVDGEGGVVLLLDAEFAQGECPALTRVT